jgi:hypothetical protein
LVARGDVDRRKEALARHLMDRITELTRRMFVDPLARPALRAEAGNIEQSMTWLLENQRIDEAIRLVGLLGTYWFSHDQSTGLRWLSRIEPHLDVCNAGTAAPARMVLGMHRQQTADECAIPQLTAALAAFTAQGRRRGAASAAFFLGRELGMDGRSNAKETLLTAVRMAREADEPLLVSWSLTWLGILANRAGSNREAERYFLEALDVSHAAGMADSMGEAFAGLAHVALFENSLDRARVLADRSVAASALTTNVRALCGSACVSPLALLFAADAGAVTSFGVEDSWVAGVGVAPVEVGVDRSGQGGVIGMVAGGDDELAERAEVRFDRVGP